MDKNGRRLPAANGALKMLVVDDDPSVAELVSLLAAESGAGDVAAAGDAASGLAALEAGSFHLVILDLGLPDRDGDAALSEFLAAADGIPVAVATADGRVETAVRCMRNGAFDFIDKPLSAARILSLFSHAAENARLRRLLGAETGSAPSPAFSRILTRSPLMLALFGAVERLAPSPLPVLIAGESGTGKELIARAIHDCSLRRGEFVPVNVAGLDGALFSDVLFGHVRGAYTGAEGARQGLVKRAEGGTLFLDEIGDIGADIQVKLLRFLQDGEYYPLGADRGERNGSRIVMATNVDLRAAVQTGRFRADLYYRLMIHSVAIPPLRDRREDIPLLVDHFAREAAGHLKLEASPRSGAFAELAATYDFPGNIRELSALVYGAVSASPSGIPSLGFLRDYISRRAADRPKAESACEDLPTGHEDHLLPLEEIEGRYIAEALRRTGGNQSAAAALLGISQSTISRALKRKLMQRE
jgi:DNA-binding NtrC family response regulator